VPAAEALSRTAREAAHGAPQALPLVALRVLGRVDLLTRRHRVLRGRRARAPQVLPAGARTKFIQVRLTEARPPV
jgi:hypothetical protein